MANMYKEGYLERLVLYIVKYVRKNGYGPALEEIGRDKTINRQRSAVRNAVLKLEKEGWLTRAPLVPRSIRPTEKAYAKYPPF